MPIIKEEIYEMVGAIIYINFSGNYDNLDKRKGKKLSILKTQGYPEVPHKRVENPQRRRYRRWYRSTEHLGRIQQGLVFPDDKPDRYNVWIGDTLQ